MEWSEIERAMVIVAHPDDAEYGCSGTVARLTADGKRVVYAIVTDGSKGSSDPAMTPERLSALREQEQRTAAQILGVETVEFLGFPDSLLEPSIEVRKAVVAAIRRHKPDVVLSQNPNRDFGMFIFAQHPDHLAAGEAVLAAVYPAARDRMTFPELLAEGLEPHAVREVWVMAAEPAPFAIDITSTLERKLEALAAHASQVDPERIREFIPQRAHALGQQHGFEAAESFVRLEIP